MDLIWSEWHIGNIPPHLAKRLRIRDRNEMILLAITNRTVTWAENQTTTTNCNSRFWATFRVFQNSRATSSCSSSTNKIQTSITQQHGNDIMNFMQHPNNIELNTNHANSGRILGLQTAAMFIIIKSWKTTCPEINSKHINRFSKPSTCII